MYKHADKVVSSIFSMLVSTIVLGIASPIIFEQEAPLGKSNFLALVAATLALGLLLFHFVLPIVRSIIFHKFTDLGDYCGLYVEVYQLGKWAVISPFAIVFDSKLEKLKVRGYAFRVKDKDAPDHIQMPTAHSWQSMTVNLSRDSQSDIVTLNYLYVSASTENGADQPPGVTRVNLRRNACSTGSFTHLGIYSQSYRDYVASAWAPTTQGLRRVHELASNMCLAPTVHFSCFKVSDTHAALLSGTRFPFFDFLYLDRFSRRAVNMNSIAKILSTGRSAEIQKFFPYSFTDFEDAWSRINQSK